MAVNVRVLQAAVTAAVLDPNFQRMLLTERAVAVQLLPLQPCMPPVQLTAEDRDAIFRLPASSFQALAEGVRQLKLAERHQSRRGDAAARAGMDEQLALAS